MVLTIGAWYNEPGIYFEFSYRISNFIREAIKESVMQPLGLLEVNPETFLHVTVTTTSTQDKLEVKMGQIRTNSKNIECGLWFPYNSIMSSKTPLEDYVDNFINSIPLVFMRLNITEEQINEVAKKIRAEIIGNSHYLLTKEEQEELDEEKQRYKEIRESRN